MRVPAPSQVAGQTLGASQVALLFEEPPRHGGELSNLDVFETQLPREAIALGLGFARHELRARAGREEILLFIGRVPPEFRVEGLDCLTRRLRRPGMRRSEETAEKVVECAVRAGQPLDRVHARILARVRRLPDNGSMPENARVAVALGFMYALCVAAGCGKKGDPIQETLDRLVKAAHARDASAVMENVASDFQGADGSARTDAEQTLRQYFAAYEELDVELSNVQIERSENTARVRLRASLSGRPAKLGGLSGLLPSSAKYDFDFRMSRDGSRWKISWASWMQAS